MVSSAHNLLPGLNAEIDSTHLSTDKMRLNFIPYEQSDLVAVASGQRFFLKVFDGKKAAK